MLLSTSPSPPKKYSKVLNSLRTVTAMCDSAASCHYWRNEDIDVLNNVVPYNGTTVTLPDNTKIKPTKQGIVPLSSAFSTQAKTATYSPALRSASLLAVAPLCDDDKQVVFDR